METERFELDGEILAVRIRASPSKEGFHLVTSPEDALQVGRNARPAGYVARAHWHPPSEPAAAVPRQEVLHVLRGRLRVDLFSTTGKSGPSLVLAPGETLLLWAAHSTEALEAVEVLEIKQGPYPGPDRDKVFLQG